LINIQSIRVDKYPRVIKLIKFGVLFVLINLQDISTRIEIGIDIHGNRNENSVSVDKYPKSIHGNRIGNISS
jgi:hypothetical protein